VKVLHLSTYDVVGGASRAAWRLHEGLRRIGVGSHMLVRTKASDDPDVALATTTPERFLHRTWRKLAPYLDDLPRPLLRTTNVTPISPAWVPGPTASDINRAAPDIVNLHWVCGGFTRPEALPHLRAPIVWTLHDEWAFSGGDHYAAGSTRWRDGYGAENRPSGEAGLDVNRWVWKRKRRAYAKVRRLAIVAPSRWLAARARESALFRDRPVSLVPYGVDAARFSPIEKGVARRLLGLPPDRPLVLFGAFGGAANPRKGYDRLAQALAGRDLDLAVFGGHVTDAPVRVHQLGRLHDDVALCLAYAAADVFVSTASEDNLPLTIMESMACGTPVVAFEVGGVADLIEDHANGRRVPMGDAAALGAALDWVFADGTRRQALGGAARRTIETGFTLEHQARAYARLYEDLMREP
jgi:glycosyltransferase involved in cell wall biosynthesis